MQDLQLIGVHEDGEHLLLVGADGERFQMPLNEELRAAIRRDRPRLGQLQIEVDGGLRPRDVQSLIRAGHSCEETASRAGWSVEKVHRYEGPILAEREHVAGLAQRVRLRSHPHESAHPDHLRRRIGARRAGTAAPSPAAPAHPPSRHGSTNDSKRVTWRSLTLAGTPGGPRVAPGPLC